MKEVKELIFGADTFEIMDGKVRQSINEFTNQEYNKIIVISDSYGAGYNPNAESSYSTPFLTYFKNLIGYTDDNFLSSVMGGTGFYATDGSNRNWLTLLTNLVNTLSNDDKQFVKEVYFIGGFNDHEGTYEQITTEINNVYNYIITNLPNAKMKVGMVGYHTKFNQYLTRRKLTSDVLSAYSQTFTDKPKYLYLDGIENITHDCRCISSDGLHPNEYGQKEIGRFLYCHKNNIQYYIKNYNGHYAGKCTYSFLDTLKPASYNNIECFKYVYGNITEFIITCSLYSELNLTLTDNCLTLSSGSLKSASSGNCENLTFLRKYTESSQTFSTNTYLPDIDVYKVGGGTVKCSGMLFIDEENKLSIRFDNLDSSITEIKGIVIPRTSIVLPTIQC